MAMVDALDVHKVVCLVLLDQASSVQSVIQRTSSTCQRLYAVMQHLGSFPMDKEVVRPAQKSCVGVSSVPII